MVLARPHFSKYQKLLYQESERISTAHIYIDLLSGGGVTLPSECLVTCVCDCFPFIDHAML